LPLEAKQKLLENPQLLELSIDPRNGSDPINNHLLRLNQLCKQETGYLTMHEEDLVIVKGDAIVTLYCPALSCQ
jgi:hypothetical protein